MLPANVENAKRQFAQAKPMREIYEDVFGEYPFAKDGFKLIEVPYSGMEHQSAVTYGNRWANGYLERDYDRRTSGGVGQVGRVVRSRPELQPVEQCCDGGRDCVALDRCSGVCHSPLSISAHAPVLPAPPAYARRSRSSVIFACSPAAISNSSCGSLSNRSRSSPSISSAFFPAAQTMKM